VVVARLLGLESVLKAQKIPVQSQGKTVGSCKQAADGGVTISLLAGAVAELPTEAISAAIADVLGNLRAQG
jgi:ParB family chromosome partitioning protein